MFKGICSDLVSFGIDIDDNSCSLSLCSEDDIYLIAEISYNKLFVGEKVKIFDSSSSCTFQSKEKYYINKIFSWCKYILNKEFPSLSKYECCLSVPSFINIGSISLNGDLIYSNIYREIASEFDLIVLQVVDKITSFLSHNDIINLPQSIILAFHFGQDYIEAAVADAGDSVIYILSKSLAFLDENTSFNIITISNMIDNISSKIDFLSKDYDYVIVSEENSIPEYLDIIADKTARNKKSIIPFKSAAVNGTALRSGQLKGLVKDSLILDSCYFGFLINNENYYFPGEFPLKKDIIISLNKNEDCIMIVFQFTAIKGSDVYYFYRDIINIMLESVEGKIKNKTINATLDIDGLGGFSLVIDKNKYKFNVLEATVQNDSGIANSFIGAGLGLGAGLNLGKSVSINNDGSKLQVDIKQKLIQLKDLYESGLISEIEYNNKKEELIRDL